MHHAARAGKGSGPNLCAAAGLQVTTVCRAYHRFCAAAEFVPQAELLLLMHLPCMLLGCCKCASCAKLRPNCNVAQEVVVQSSSEAGDMEQLWNAPIVRCSDFCKTNAFAYRCKCRSCRPPVPRTTGSAGRRSPDRALFCVSTDICGHSSQSRQKIDRIQYFSQLITAQRSHFLPPPPSTTTHPANGLASGSYASCTPVTEDTLPQAFWRPPMPAHQAAKAPA